MTSDGGTEVTVRGVCWSTTPNPTIANNHTIDGDGEGEFTSNITGLTPGTTYYIKAYATNDVGTNYGSQKIFQTPEDIQLPTVVTYPVSVSSITPTTAECGGNVLLNSQYIAIYRK